VVSVVQRLRREYPRVLETALPIVIVATVLLAAGSGPELGRHPLDAVGVLAIVAANAPIMFRLRAPVAVLLVCGASSTLYAALGYWEPLINYGLLVALYTVTTLRPLRVTLPSGVYATGVLVTSALLAGERPGWLTVLLSTVFAVVAWALGEVRRLLSVRNEQLAVLTARLARERTAQAQRAVVDERIRIARELHDVVAHHMSVIAVQAGLARYVLTSDPETATVALRTVATSSSEALEELQLMLTLLRTDPDQPLTMRSGDPVPGFDRLGELTDRVAAAGVPVSLRVLGIARPLVPGVELSAYRIIQESLTNTLKHAGPARAEVTVEYGADRFTVRVTDDGTGPKGGAEHDANGGHGLIGMRERARLYGGTLQARARPSGGFEVVLTVPMSAAAVSEQSQRAHRARPDR
jgi:signal transduction histidine kinase